MWQWAFEVTLGALLLSLRLSLGGVGLIAKDQVKTGDIARTFPLGVDALRAGWHCFVTLWVMIFKLCRTTKIIVNDSHLDFSLSAVLAASTWLPLINHGLKKNAGEELNTQETVKDDESNFPY